MDTFQNNFTLLLKRTGLLLLIYFLCRLLFLLFNFSYFSSIDSVVILKSFFFGIRFDITAIVISNLLFISMHLLPFRFFYTKFYQAVLKSVFLLVNIPMILFNCIDFGLYRFTGKRSGSEIFSIMSFGNDFVNTVPRMIIDFWHLLIVFLTLSGLLIMLYPRLRFEFPGKGLLFFFYRRKSGKLFLFILFAGLTFLGFRGGSQYKPLNILSASRYGTGKTAELILNTPFTIIKTFGKNTLEEINWLPEKIAESETPLIKYPDTGSGMQKKNVVILILEGIGKEYIGSLNKYKGYTPFLDSLFRKGFVFTNAFANGKRSIEGIPAILAGIPALMHEPFITSVYSGNSVTSVVSLLKPEGYSSIFFHGGTNGTMGFDNFSRLAGFDKYYGRSEYNDDSDFDGSWGIYDEPFLQKTIVELNKMSQPFVAAVFTLSSHHPYKIPEKYSTSFPKGTLPIHQSIGYADYSLRQFFKTASGMDWYEHTVFVITADHTAESEYAFYRNHVGLFSVPIVFYSPGDSLLHGSSRKTTQQIDILPGLMDYLNYDKPYFAFGESMFHESSPGYAVQYIDDSYQLIQDNHMLVMDSIRKNSLYNFVADSSLLFNLSAYDTLTAGKMELKLRSVVQQFNRVMIHNKMRLNP